MSHKGGVWRWQNARCLRDDLGIDVRFYLLHRDGSPFANMLSATRHVVGHFGRVYTRPEDRRKGAASALMRHLMEDFRRRKGRALFLGTGYDSAPFHIYQAEGFRGLEPESGLMDYYVGSGETFRREWFSIGPVEVGAVSWENWPTSAPLFTGPFPGTVRMAPLGMFGRVSTESGWLHLDLPGDRWLAVSDDGCPEKEAVLAVAGFTATGGAASRVAVDAGKTRLADIKGWERRR